MWVSSTQGYEAPCHVGAQGVTGWFLQELECVKACPCTDWLRTVHPERAQVPPSLGIHRPSESSLPIQHIGVE